MELIAAGLAGLAIGVLAMRIIYEQQRAFINRTIAAETAESNIALNEELPEPEDKEHSQESIYDIAEKFQSFFENVATAADVLEHPLFCEGVAAMRARGRSTEELVNYYNGSNIVLACWALEVLREREDRAAVKAQLLEGLADSVYIKRFFELRVLASLHGETLVSSVLLQSSRDYLDRPQHILLRDFVAARVAAGEPLVLGDIPAENHEAVTKLLQAVGDIALPLIEQLSPVETPVNIETLRSIGRVWEESSHESTKSEYTAIEHQGLTAHVVAIEEALGHIPARSVVVVGEAGTGKTSLLRIVGRRLHSAGWVVFEAGGRDLVAGQIYIGQLEQRIGELIRQLGDGKKVVWIIPELHTLLWDGTHKHQASSVIDQLLPAIESGALKIIGVTAPAGYEQILRLKPRLRTAVETVRLYPTDRQETLAIARAWATLHSGADSELISKPLLEEAYQYAVQYIGEKATPGSLLQLLEATRHRLVAATGVAERLTLDELIVTLAQQTGLPAAILDERQSIDLAALRSFFAARVYGQDEAVECLVERVAMIKAGLTDPRRPQGVFLFAGPTGTGKTEIARTLAEFLFGSPDRMIRLDMSEFQTPESLSRLLGEHDDFSAGTALVNKIRNQPFSLVLLDECEKAHPNVWDLFLQVFDDGRLTDRRGNTADFRHCIIILTSNLGAAIARGSGLGFASSGAQFSPSSVEKAIEQEFRKEFLNRIDRVVVFRPLSRSTMKDVLRKELQAVLQRRGFRNRTWAVEWEDSAVEFLLAQGFTPDLGARPLKRAVERYVLAPLSTTIVNHQFPEGEQFLFVRSDGKGISVEFIDPDAGMRDAEMPEGGSLSLQQIVLHPQGNQQEYAVCLDCWEQLANYTRSEEWSKQKQELLEAAAAEELWNSSERFVRLGRAEYMGRIEAGMETAEALLQQFGDSSDSAAALLAGRLAQQLYLLSIAVDDVVLKRPVDAFVLVEAGGEVAGLDALALVGEMYRQWAVRRKMQFHVLEEKTGVQGRLLFSVSGYGAYELLRKEEGIHAFELRSGTDNVLRCVARVYIMPQPEAQPYGIQGIHNAASRAIAERLAALVGLPVVRRYRLGDAPLVRDSVRQWKTGRIERVLTGDFDLLA